MTDGLCVRSVERGLNTTIIKDIVMSVLNKLRWRWIKKNEKIKINRKMTFPITLKFQHL